jgi:5-methylcytosine-specific restriction endonuclease McrA
MGWRDTGEWYSARNWAMRRDGMRCCGILDDGMRCQKVQEDYTPMPRGARRPYPGPVRLHIHHIVPVSKGGACLALDNLVTLCPQCHGAVEAGYRKAYLCDWWAS